MKRLQKTALIILRVLLVLLFLITLPYYNTLCYDFPEPRSFSGRYWYNPYENLPQHALKANLHAHARAWGGLTNGKHAPEEMFHSYEQQGYQIALLTDYLQVTAQVKEQTHYFPAYEHGINLQRVHLNVFGNDKVQYFSYPHFFTASQKQQLINTLNKGAKFISINHPSMSSAFTEKDMQRLCNYRLLEVQTGFAMSVQLWDAALTAGKPVFLLCNDDAHAADFGNFRFWNMIFSGDAGIDSVAQALLAGRHYGVFANWGTIANVPVLQPEVSVLGDALEFNCGVQFDSIKVIGDGGKCIGSFYNTNALFCTLSKDVSYARIALYNAAYTVYLNPVMRYHGGDFFASYNRQPVVNRLETALAKTIVLSFHLACIFTFLKLRRKK
jgi:hypothetical protein